MCINWWIEHGQAVGDPTETALLLAARAVGPPADAPAAHQRRLREIPFDSHRRRMTVVVDWNGAALVVSKGAPAEVLAHCQSWRGPAGDESLDRDRRRLALAANDSLAARGFRVLAVALRPLASQAAEPLEAADRARAERSLLTLPPSPLLPRPPTTTCSDKLYDRATEGTAKD